MCVCVRGDGVRGKVCCVAQNVAVRERENKRVHFAVCVCVCACACVCECEIESGLKMVRSLSECVPSTDYLVEDFDNISAT